MTNRESYAPGRAMDARVEKGEDTWTLILVRELRHPPAMVWQALIDPEQLREWAPFEAEGERGKAGATVKLRWVATASVTEVRVTRAEAPNLLEYGNMRWQLEHLGRGTRLTLWHGIPPGYIAWGAAGWHIAFDVLDRLLAGTPIGRIAGANAMKSDWHRLVGEYAQQFGIRPAGAAGNAQSDNS